MSDLVRQLREFPQFVSMDPGRWFQSGSKEPICQRAADELERLTRELEEWRKLKDPEVLHVNLLRGIPATLSRDKLLHLVGDVGLEEARKDAERLDWLNTRHGRLFILIQSILFSSKESWRAAIDAAMSQEK